MTYDTSHHHADRRVSSSAYMMSAGATSPVTSTSSRCGDRSGRRLVERWFYPGIATLMLVTAIAGFAPAAFSPAGRRGPVSLLAAVHGLVFFAWLLIFLFQTLLVASERVVWHRRLGVASAFLLVSMVPLGYQTTIEMVRRGYDLSGDQYVGFNPDHRFIDAQTGAVFNLASLFLFASLTAGALWFRRRLAIHKRLMLFANVQLTGASLTHLLGHASLLSPLTVIGAISLFLIAAVWRDWFVDRRIHRLTAALATMTFVLLPMEGALIGPSSAWHYLVDWLARTG